MSSITFDTFKFVERLEKAGVPREQAAAIVEAQKEAFAEALDTALATKADVVRLEGRIDSLGKDMQSMELRLTVKLGAFMAAAVGVLVAILKSPF